jgi:hypothetical protein
MTLLVAEVVFLHGEKF